MIAQATRTFTNGVAAYDRGEYAIAQEVWRPLTHSGDPAAQRNLAHLYRMGLGVAQDFVESGRMVRDWLSPLGRTIHAGVT